MGDCPGPAVIQVIHSGISVVSARARVLGRARPLADLAACTINRSGQWIVLGRSVWETAARRSMNPDAPGRK